ASRRVVREDRAGRIVGKRREHVHFPSALHEMLAELRQPRLRSAHLRRKILGENAESGHHFAARRPSNDTTGWNLPAFVRGSESTVSITIVTSGPRRWCMR